jgi:hypothetical protein
VERSIGFVVFVGLLLLAGLVRWHESRRASGLLEAEDRTRTALAALYDASRLATEDGVRHPGLRGKILAGVPGLQPVPDLGTEQISYARDAEYMYGLATRTIPDARTSVVRQGFVLRAWPVEFGSTGDLDFQLADDGELWQGQNLVGRSGTSVGFPPRFPDPAVGKPDEAWWTVPLPGHR